MTTSLTDQLQDDSPAPDADGSQTAVAENLCPHCSAPGLGETAEWCLKCGYFPKFNFCIDVDPEQASTAEERAVWDPRRVPGWIWILVAGLVAVTTVSLVGRFAFPFGSLTRALWAIGQLILGTIAFGIVHLMAYLTAIAEDSELKLLDIVLRPFRTWRKTVYELPATAKRVCIGAWALTLAVMGPAVVGGIPYHLLWEMGPEEQAPPNLVHAIVDAADNAAGDEMEMEEALEDFTGKAADEEEEKPPVDPYAPENLPKRKHKLDCLIIGYKPNGSSGFASLVLAAVLKDKLQVVGTVSNEFISPELRAEMFSQLHTIECQRPIVPTTIEAVWVQPQMTCRVGHNGFGASNRVTETVFQKRLSDVDLGK